MCGIHQNPIGLSSTPCQCALKGFSFNLIAPRALVNPPVCDPSMPDSLLFQKRLCPEPGEGERLLGAIIGQIFTGLLIRPTNIYSACRLTMEMNWGGGCFPVGRPIKKSHSMKWHPDIQTEGLRILTYYQTYESGILHISSVSMMSLYVILLSSFYRWGNWGSKELSDLFKVHR